MVKECLPKLRLGNTSFLPDSVVRKGVQSSIGRFDEKLLPIFLDHGFLVGGSMDTDTWELVNFWHLNMAKKQKTKNKKN